MEKKAPKEYRPGQYVRVKLSGGRIEEAKIAAVIPRDDGVRLQVDFGHDETALVELWQIVEDRFSRP
jgi:NAD(P)H-flavin reductase